MSEEYKNKTNVGVGTGILLQFLAQVLFGARGQGNPAAYSVLMLLGAVAFIYGCCSYAKGKGYPAILGLLGLFSCLGLVILVLLPVRQNN